MSKYKARTCVTAKPISILIPHKEFEIIDSFNKSRILFVVVVVQLTGNLNSYAYIFLILKLSFYA